MRSFLLGLVPKCCRTWPVLRRFFWQKEDLERARARAEEMARFFRGEE